MDHHSIQTNERLRQGTQAATPPEAADGVARGVHSDIFGTMHFSGPDLRRAAPATSDWTDFAARAIRRMRRASGAGSAIVAVAFLDTGAPALAQTTILNVSYDPTAA
jgi:hypothetical protein